MARPRKPEDRDKYPTACARCKGHYSLVKRWPDGTVCEYCYVAAKRVTGVCACGHKCQFSNDLSHSHLICRNRVSFSFDLSYAS